jgi:hypothetical protein
LPHACSSTCVSAPRAPPITSGPDKGPSTTHDMNPKRPCRQPGCPNETGRTYSPLCSSHRRAFERHGHPDQRPVFLRELAPSIKVLKRRMVDNADNEAWRILEARWRAIVGRAAAVVADAEAGRPHFRSELRASTEVLAVARVAPPAAVIARCLAVGMLNASNLYRFKSQRAFEVCMAKLFLRLGPGNSMRYWNHKLRKMSTVSRDWPAQVVALIGQSLVAAFAGPAAQLVAIEAARRPPEEVEQARLTAALQALIA